MNFTNADLQKIINQLLQIKLIFWNLFQRVNLCPPICYYNAFSMAKVEAVSELNNLKKKEKRNDNITIIFSHYYVNILCTFSRCSLRCDFLANDFRHTQQWNCFGTPHSYLKCLIKLYLLLYRRPHRFVHSKKFSGEEMPAGCSKGGRQKPEKY